jgi:hypothetical protein
MKKGFNSIMTSINSVGCEFRLGELHHGAGREKTTGCMDVMFRMNPFVNETTLKVDPVEVASEVSEDSLLTTKLPSEPWLQMSRFSVNGDVQVSFGRNETRNSLLTR